MTTLTIEDARTWRMREDAHFNGGAEFFAYLHRCIEQPRLARYDRYYRKTRAVTSTWRIDGRDQLSLVDAVDALNSPPVFDAAELAFLISAPSDYESERRSGEDYGLLRQVHDKGAIEFEQGRYRLTAIGRAALETSP